MPGLDMPFTDIVVEFDGELLLVHVLKTDVSETE